MRADFALLYDAVDLSPLMRAFVLGLDEPDAKRRVDRFRDLVAAASASLMSWNPRVRPFERLIFDPTHILMRTTTREDGRPSGPWHRRFWETAFESTAIPDASESPRNLAAEIGQTHPGSWT